MSLNREHELIAEEDTLMLKDHRRALKEPKVFFDVLGSCDNMFETDKFHGEM